MRSFCKILQLSFLNNSIVENYISLQGRSRYVECTHSHKQISELKMVVSRHASHEKMVDNFCSKVDYAAQREWGIINNYRC